MIARILAWLGGTPCTPTAIRYAVERAKVHQAEVLGMTVLDRRRLGVLIRASGTAQDAVWELKRLDEIEKHQEKSIADFESACTHADLRYAVDEEAVWRDGNARYSALDNPVVS